MSRQYFFVVYFLVSAFSSVSTWSLADQPLDTQLNQSLEREGNASPAHAIAEHIDLERVRLRHVQLQQLPDAAVAGEEWKSLFNGKNLEGWKVSENPDSIVAKDGQIVVKGERAHAFFVGDQTDKEDDAFTDFHFKAKVKTMPNANSGIYFHTSWLESGWPNKGYEAQVNNTQSDPKKTGGLYGVQDNFQAPVKDEEWFDYDIIVRGKHIVVKINGETVSDYTEPADLDRPERQLSSGTFALQAHDPGSKVHYKDLKVRRLTSDAATSLVFEPKANANGKHTVLVAGDEEYRSEESCPMLGKILSQRHGFKCTVVFSINADGGYIDPNATRNIPAISALDSADLMIIGTRFRDLPDEQMKHILKYISDAKPVIGFRTATHAFKKSCKYGDYDWGNFGANVIGENWVAHHGKHKVEGGKSVAVAGHEGHPILKSVGEIFTPSDIYTVKRVTPENANILLRGAVTESLEPESKILEDPRNEPMQPFVWLKSYDSPSGKQGKTLATTAGASVDYKDEDLRRLIVNASYHLLDLEVPEKADVEPVDEFNPSFYGFYREKGYFANRNLRVSDFELGKSARTIVE